MSKERKQLSDEGPNGNLGRAKGYKTPVGDTYETAVTEGKASAGTFSVGKSNDADAATMANRAAKLQKNAEQVKQVDPNANAGLCKQLASGNPDGDASKRTTNCWGTETVPGTGVEN